MESDFVDNFTPSEQRVLVDPNEYQQAEHWHFLFTVALLIAFFILLNLCLTSVGTFEAAKGRMHTPKKHKAMIWGVC
jgi:hypothetical protein